MMSALAAGRFAAVTQGLSVAVNQELDMAIPSGSVIAYGGAAAPIGWLLCDGASYLRADYPDLFAVIDVAYGAADGTHFSVPDLRSNYPKGKGIGDSLGGVGGATTHTHAGHSNHVVTQPSAHSNHIVSQPSNHIFTQPSGHSAHVVTQPTQAADSFGTTKFTTSGNGTAAFTSETARGAITGTAVDAHSAHVGGAVDAHSGTAVDAHSAHAGADVNAHSAHDTVSNEPPYQIVNFIIKT